MSRVLATVLCLAGAAVAMAEFTITFPSGAPVVVSSDAVPSYGRRGDPGNTSFVWSDYTGPATWIEDVLISGTVHQTPEGLPTSNSLDEARVTIGASITLDEAMTSLDYNYQTQTDTYVDTPNSFDYAFVLDPNIVFTFTFHEQGSGTQNDQVVGGDDNIHDDINITFVEAVPTYAGTLAGAPTWYRAREMSALYDPNGVCDPWSQLVHYHAQEFIVSEDGVYELKTSHHNWNVSSFLHLYEYSFNPEDQCTNIIQSKWTDQWGARLYDVSLVAGRHYFLVLSEFEPTAHSGDFIAEINGPGEVRVIGPCVGDIDGDGQTDLSDLAALLGSYGKCPGEPGYNPFCNTYEADPPDGCVGLNDLATLLGDYGCGN